MLTNISEKEAGRKVLSILICGAIFAIYVFWSSSSFDEKSHDLARRSFPEIFKTPINKVQFDEGVWGMALGNWKVDFEVISPTEPLVIDKSFRNIKLDFGALGRRKESWMTRCYFRPHNEFKWNRNGYLNGDVWIYTDSAFSKAYIIGETKYQQSLGNKGFAHAFAEIYRTSPDEVVFGEYYCTNNIICFEVISASEPLTLQENHSLQNIDPSLSTIEFPPGQKKYPWMTKCFYYSQSASGSKQECWIFTDNSMKHNYVIVKLPTGQKLYQYAFSPDHIPRIDHHYADLSRTSNPIIQSLNQQLLNSQENQKVREDFAAIFKTPFEKIQISQYQSRWDGYEFQISSTSQPLDLQDTGLFRPVPLEDGALGKDIEPWMTRCYFQGKPPLSASRRFGEAWIYTNDSFSRAYFTRKLWWYALSLNGFRYDIASSDFSKIFKNSPARVDISNYYGINNHSCFEINARIEPLVLQDGRFFQNIDLKSCTVAFPPWQDKETWMTNCYYCCCPPDFSAPQRDFWIFSNPTLSHAYVIIQASGESGFLNAKDPIAPEFAKIFQTLQKNTKKIAYYQKQNKIYFEVWGQLDHMRLKDNCPFQKIDLKSCPVDFPSKWIKEPWMANCYHYTLPASVSEPKEEFWIFIEGDDQVYASVVAQYEK